MAVHSSAEIISVHLLFKLAMGLIYLLQLILYSRPQLTECLAREDGIEPPQHDFGDQPISNYLYFRIMGGEGIEPTRDRSRRFYRPALLLKGIPARILGTINNLEVIKIYIIFFLIYFYLLFVPIYFIFKLLLISSSSFLLPQQPQSFLFPLPSNYLTFA